MTAHSKLCAITFTVHDNVTDTAQQINIVRKDLADI